MSTHAAQRLVSLFHLLARRYNRLQAAAEGAAEPPTPTAAYAAADSPLTPWLPAPTPQQQALQGAHQAAQQQDAQQQQQQQDAQQAAEQQDAQQQQPQPRVEAVAQQQGLAAGGGVSEQQELELQLYADFLRIVLEVRALLGQPVCMPWLSGRGWPCQASPACSPATTLRRPACRSSTAS